MEDPSSTATSLKEKRAITLFKGQQEIHDNQKLNYFQFDTWFAHVKKQRKQVKYSKLSVHHYHQFQLALLLDQGYVNQKNKEKTAMQKEARELYQQLASQNYPPVQYIYDYQSHSFTGEYTPETKVSRLPFVNFVFHACLKAAKQNYSAEQYFIGQVFHYGFFGLKKDPLQAAYWYRRSAKQGNSDAIDAIKKLPVNRIDRWDWKESNDTWFGKAYTAKERASIYYTTVGQLKLHDQTLSALLYTHGLTFGYNERLTNQVYLELFMQDEALSLQEKADCLLVFAIQKLAPLGKTWAAVLPTREDFGLPPKKEKTGSSAIVK